MHFYKTLLRLDMATLTTDSKLKKLIIKYILRPIGYWARRKNFHNTMKQKQPYTIHYRITPTSPVQTQTVFAYSEEHARLVIKHENDVTHNQIVFID